MEDQKNPLGLIHFGMWVDSVDEMDKKITAAGGAYVTGRKETNPNVYYEVKYKTPGRHRVRRDRERLEGRGEGRQAGLTCVRAGHAVTWHDACMAWHRSQIRDVVERVQVMNNNHRAGHRHRMRSGHHRRQCGLAGPHGHANRAVRGRRHQRRAGTADGRAVAGHVSSRPSSCRTRSAPAASSARPMRRTPSPTATRCCLARSRCSRCRL